MTFFRGQDGLGTDANVDVLMMQQEQDDRVCMQASGKSERPSLLLPLDRQTYAIKAMADRFFRLVSTLKLRDFCSQCRVHNVTNRVRDHHPQIGKLEIGMCCGLHGASEGEIQIYDAQTMRLTSASS